MRNPIAVQLWPRASQVVLVTLLMISPSSGQEFRPSDGFLWTFGMSFGYDLCGDRELGEDLRSVTQSLLGQCELSNDEQSSLVKEFAKMRAQIPKEISEFQNNSADADNKSVATARRRWGDLFVCDDASYKSRAGSIRDLLSRYERGEVSTQKVLAAILPACSKEQ